MDYIFISSGICFALNINQIFFLCLISVYHGCFYSIPLLPSPVSWHQPHLGSISPGGSRQTTGSLKTLRPGTSPLSWETSLALQGNTTEGTVSEKSSRPTNQPTNQRQFTV